jgi:SAM-dependent methyltransferase
LDEAKGMPVQNVWNDIESLRSWHDERMGYPTQKPEALLERIVNASSNEGDTVFDPFCGCGTTIAAAQKLNRKWIGIDITYLSIFLVEKRLREAFGEAIVNTYAVYGSPYDVPSAQALWNKNKKEFEIWAVRLIGATPRKQDGGVDGVLGFLDEKRKTQPVVVQVKGGETLNPGIVRDLIGTVEKEKAAIGLLISLHEPTSGMAELAVHAGSYTSELWKKSYPRIQIRTIKDLLIDGKQFDLPPHFSSLKKAERIKEEIKTENML